MRSAIGALPLVLSLIALDHATTDRWAVAEATYLEAIGLARETGQQTDLAFGLSGLARLQARRGRDTECRANVAEALQLCERAWDAAARGVGRSRRSACSRWVWARPSERSSTWSISNGWSKSSGSPTPTSRRRPS